MKTSTLGGDGSKLAFRTSFHHMDESGGYDGWTEHIVTARATFNGPELKISGADRNGIKEYIAECFSAALAGEVSDEFLLKAGE